MNTLLVVFDRSAKDIKGMHHDLEERVSACQDHGLILRKRTLEHLNDLTKRREYTVSRYEPEIHKERSQINRLMATLDEIASKTAKLLVKKGVHANAEGPNPPITRDSGSRCA